MPITSKSRRKSQIVVRDSGHPAAFNKIRCTKCSIGYAVRSITHPNKYTCERCGTSFSVSKL